LEALCTRAIAHGWMHILFGMILNGVPVNMIDNYGLITEDMVVAHMNTYMFQDIRATQDSHNSFQGLESSVTPETRSVLYAERKKYTIRRGDVPNAIAGGDAEELRRDGLIYLWCIINCTTTTTNATISTIVRQVNRLRELMIEKDSDVTSFNTSVRQLMNA
jgi:hypothetical protein